ncbi:MAG: extracellular solute-binding protein [Clostridiales bacterium]|nr:extracellular solute-binding protein [Clostridiales bacterium]
MKGKRILRTVSVALSLALVGGLCAACAGNDPGAGKMSIKFWAWGEDSEINAYRALVNKYNEENPDYYVYLEKRPGTDYERSVEQQLAGRTPPDIFYVPEGTVRSWANQGLLADLTSYVESSSAIDLSDMWDSLMPRYQFDAKTFQGGEDKPIWGLPKDLGTMVIFYNETAFKNQGITVISVAESELEAYNEANNLSLPAKAYCTVNGKEYFNNRIAMDWEMMIQLCTKFTKSYNSASPTTYGYYSPWWFNLGWSVGGDGIRYVESNSSEYNGGYYEFSLGDTDKHYIKDGVISTVNSTGATELPSTREAFEFFVSLSNGNNGKYGTVSSISQSYGLTNPVSPVPDEVDGDYTPFYNNQVAMLVQGRYAVPFLRDNCHFDWDAAPLAKHADGIYAGHSTSMCYSIAARASADKKAAAFRFMEYMSGPAGQAELAKSGFNVPNQKSVTNSDAFLKSDRRPFNNAVFAEAAAYQRAGDWMYFPDENWIQQWAPELNNEVRNQRMSLAEFFNKVTDKTNTALKVYTAKR